MVYIHNVRSSTLVMYLFCLSARNRLHTACHISIKFVVTAICPMCSFNEPIRPWLWTAYAEYITVLKTDESLSGSVQVLWSFSSPSRLARCSDPAGPIMDSDALQDRCVSTLDMLHVTSASLPVTCATLAVQYCARMVSFPFTSSTCRAANFSSDLNLKDRKSWLNTVNTCLELTKWKYR